MVWSFLWRFVLWAAALSICSTFVVGLLMGLGGSTAERVYEVSRFVQLTAFVVSGVLAIRRVRRLRPT